jgi:hypothetical protein
MVLHGKLDHGQSKKEKKKEEEEEYISESYASVTALDSWITKICGTEVYLIN